MMTRYFEINEQGHNVRCKLYCKDIPSTTKVVIYGHGFGGHKDNKAAERFAEYIISKNKGFAVVTFNLPAHGDDVKRKLTLDDCTTYLDFVIAHARNQLGAQELYCYATSFGGYLTLKYLIDKGENPFQKIALRCPALKMFEVMSGRLAGEEDKEKLRKGKEATLGFDRKILVDQKFLDDLEAADLFRYEFFDYADDILILHGTKDEIVNEEWSREFAENNVIEYIPVEGADHRFQDLKKMELANVTIARFFGL